MALDVDGNQIIPPAAGEDGDGGFYCRRCDTVDCEWLGVCPHTPMLWRALRRENPTPSE